jgi:hypothetical protein
VGPVVSGNWATTRIEKQKNVKTAQIHNDFIFLSLTKALFPQMGASTIMQPGDLPSRTRIKT